MTLSTYEDFFSALEKFKKANNPLMKYTQDNFYLFQEICEAIKQFNKFPDQFFKNESVLSKELKIARLRSEISIFIENLDWERTKIEKLEKKLKDKELELSSLKSNKSRFQVWSSSYEKELQDDIKALQKEIIYFEDEQKLLEHLTEEHLRTLKDYLENPNNPEFDPINIYKKETITVGNIQNYQELLENIFPPLDQESDESYLNKQKQLVRLKKEYDEASEDNNKTEILKKMKKVVEENQQSEPDDSYLERVDRIVKNFDSRNKTKQNELASQFKNEDNLISILNREQLLARMRLYLPQKEKETESDYIQKVKSLNELYNNYKEPNMSNNLDEMKKIVPQNNNEIEADYLKREEKLVKLKEEYDDADQTRKPEILKKMNEEAYLYKVRKIAQLYQAYEELSPAKQGSLENQALEDKLKTIVKTPLDENTKNIQNFFKDYDNDSSDGDLTNLKKYMEVQEGQSDEEILQNARDAVKLYDAYQKSQSPANDSFEVYSSKDNPILNITYKIGNIECSAGDISKKDQSLHSGLHQFKLPLVADSVVVQYPNNASLTFKKQGSVVFKGNEGLQGVIQVICKRLDSVPNPSINVSNLESFGSNQKKAKEIFIRELVYAYCVNLDGQVDVEKFYKIKDALTSSSVDKNGKSIKPFLSRSELLSIDKNNPYIFLLSAKHLKKDQEAEIEKASFNKVKRLPSEMSENSLVLPPSPLVMSSSTTLQYKKRMQKIKELSNENRTWKEFLTLQSGKVDNQQMKKIIDNLWAAIFESRVQNWKTSPEVAKARNQLIKIYGVESPDKLNEYYDQELNAYNELKAKCKKN